MSEFENNLEERDDHLNQQIEEHPAEESIRVLVKDAHRRTRQLRLLTATVVLTLLMAIGLVFVSYKLYRITQLAQTNQNAVVANCETANDSRKNQLILWNYVFSVPARTPRTPEQEQRNEDFKKFIAKTFAPRDCRAEIN